MSSDAAPSLYSRKNPFPAKLLTNRLLTTGGSGKETRHFELSLAGSGLVYEVGDSMGVFPQNCPKLVADLLQALHMTGTEEVAGPDGEPVTLADALGRLYAIHQPSKQFLEAVVARADAAPLLESLLQPERRKQLEEYLYGLEIIDFLLDHRSIHFSPSEFVATLRKLQPRLYSIASSLRAHPEQVHFTIAAVRYQSNGRSRHGVASTFFADRLPLGGTVPVFVHSAKGFRLPEDGSTPVIMVGPGTGVAPFRAMLQERQATGATGKNWLFFGEQHAATDFLYRDELETFQAGGVLTRLSTAFSRDQDHKIYVQHRMLENAPELWAWMDAGAHFFVCGDAAHMAKDVDLALHQIVVEQGHKTVEEAAVYLEQMKKEKRYKRDVY